MWKRLWKKMDNLKSGRELGYATEEEPPEEVDHTLQPLAAGFPVYAKKKPLWVVWMLHTVDRFSVSIIWVELKRLGDGLINWRILGIVLQRSNSIGSIRGDNVNLSGGKNVHLHGHISQQCDGWKGGKGMSALAEVKNNLQVINETNKYICNTMAT